MDDSTRKIRFVTYNCFSIRRKSEIVRPLLSKCDILLCQEINLLQEYCHMLANFSELFNVKFVPSELSDSVDGDGRPKGGLAMFYRKSLKITVKPIIENFNYCLYKILYGGELFHVVNIYMPCDLRNIESNNRYQILLGEFQETLDSLDSNKILFAGDFNANCSTRNEAWLNLENFVNDNALIINDSTLPANTFTYLSPVHDTTTCLDRPRYFFKMHGYLRH